MSLQLLSTQDMAFYSKLFSNSLYTQALFNTAVFILGAVPLKMALALFLSGFLNYYNKIRIVKVLNVMYLLPWAIPAVSAALSFRWSLNYDYGIINKFLVDIGLPRVRWLLDYQTAILSVIVFHIWKWLPMWTLILLAGRKGISEEIYESAAIDGASLFRRFTGITAPLISKLFFICLLLSSIWSLGEFEAVWLVTMAGPNQLTHIITTIGYKFTFIDANLVGGLAAYMSLLPVVIVIVIILIILTRETK
jgi:multiple sugar transport system permease protein